MTAGRRPRGVGTSNPPSANDTRESAANEVAPGAHLGELEPGARDAAGIDLEAEHLDVGPGAREPGVQLERGDRARAVAEIDHERVGGAPQRRMPRDPPVDAAQPVRARRPAGHLPDGGSAASAMSP